MKQILSFSFCMIFLLSCHQKQEGFRSADISNLPDFKMLLMDSSTIFHKKDIPDGKPIIIIYFRPNCPFCQRETKTILANIKDLKKVQIYFLAGAPFEKIKEFYTTFHLNQYENIKVGKDYEYSFKSAFRPTNIPYTVIYNAQKQLIKLYSGEIGIDNLITATRG